MKYRRLPVEWYVESFRSYGFCMVAGLRYAITCTGRSWVLDEVFASESCLALGKNIGHGEVGPSESVRLAAVKALRKCLGMLPEREGWKPIRRLSGRRGYSYHVKDGHATVFPEGDWYVWPSELGPPIVTGAASTMEAAADAAERALRVRPDPKDLSPEMDLCDLCRHSPEACGRHPFDGTRMVKCGGWASRVAAAAERALGVTHA